MIFLMEDLIYSGRCYEGEKKKTKTKTQHLVCISNGEGL